MSLSLSLMTKCVSSWYIRRKTPSYLLSLSVSLSVMTKCVWSWHNRTGWLGVKHQVTDFLSLGDCRQWAVTVNDPKMANNSKIRWRISEHCDHSILLLLLLLLGTGYTSNKVLKQRRIITFAGKGQIVTEALFGLRIATGSAFSWAA